MTTSTINTDGHHFIFSNGVYTDNQTYSTKTISTSQAVYGYGAGPYDDLDKLHDVVNKANFSEHKKCAKCKHSLACMAGSLPTTQRVAKTREEHLKGYTLPCVEKGRVKLVVLSQDKAAEEDAARLRYLNQQYQWTFDTGQATTTLGGSTTGITLGPMSTIGTLINPSSGTTF